jgi:RimJ/RimL family protein N-acetyltransferase
MKDVRQRERVVLHQALHGGPPRLVGGWQLCREYVNACLEHIGVDNERVSEPRSDRSKEGTLIQTERLDLVPLSAAGLEACLTSPATLGDLIGASVPDGWPDEHDRWFLEYRLGQLRHDPGTAPWLARVIVLRDDKAMIGHAGFHGPPNERGAVEIGYTVFGPYRRRGFALESVKALMEWARTAHGIGHFIASVSPTNAPSLALVAKLGFVKTGTQWDERDGEETVFEVKTPPAHAG